MTFKRLGEGVSGFLFQPSAASVRCDSCVLHRHAISSVDPGQHLASILEEVCCIGDVTQYLVTLRCKRQDALLVDAERYAVGVDRILVQRANCARTCGHLPVNAATALLSCCGLATHLSVGFACVQATHLV